MLRIAFLYREEKQEWNEWEKFYYSQLSRVQVRVRFSSVEIKNYSLGKEEKKVLKQRPRTRLYLGH